MTQPVAPAATAAPSGTPGGSALEWDEVSATRWRSGCLGYVIDKLLSPMGPRFRAYHRPSLYDRVPLGSADRGSLEEAKQDAEAHRKGPLPA